MGALKSNISVKLGLISFPVSVESAVAETKDAAFNMVCVGTDTAHDPARIRQKNSCPICQNDDKTTFGKGKEVGGKVIIVPQSEIDAAGASDEVKKTIALTTHPAEQTTHLLPTGKVYYLSPAQGAGDSYALVAALVASREDLAFFSEFAIRSVSSMYQLISRDGVLMIQEFAWPEQVKALPNVPEVANEALLGQASVFADMLKADFEAETYRDKRTIQLAAFMATQEGLSPAAVAGDETGGTAAPTSLDLSSMLTAAIQAQGAAKSPRAAKKTAKTAVKKAAAKKTAKAS